MKAIAQLVKWGEQRWAYTARFEHEGDDWDYFETRWFASRDAATEYGESMAARLGWPVECVSDYCDGCGNTGPCICAEVDCPLRDGRGQG